MAEGISKKIIGISDIKVNSAGTNVLSGMPPTSEAILVMRERNIDISKHVSTKLTKELINSADYIFVMTKDHLKYVLKLYPEKSDKIFILKEFSAIGRKLKNKISKNSNDEISDPIGKGIQSYRLVAKELKINIKIIINRIIKENK